MEKNIVIIQNVVDYIETHLEDKLDLEKISKQAGYSKYHLHRMFFGVIGFIIHQYVQRRRLTEAARMLVFTKKTLIEIALSSGYETQQSFAMGFKALFQCSPQVFRKKHKFCPFQLKFCVDGNQQLRGKILNVKIIERDKIRLAGFLFDIRFGFSNLGKYWEKLHAEKHSITNRADIHFLVGLNDYSPWIPEEEKQPDFDYYLGAEVTSFLDIPKERITKELPASKYAVFYFQAKKPKSQKSG